MYDLMLFTLPFIVACIVITVVVWLVMKAKSEPVKLNSESGDKLAEKPVMQAGDWINATVNIVCGVFMGVALESLIRLMTTDSWPVAVLISLLAAGLIFFVSLFDGLVDRVFSNGIRPAHKPQTVRRAPLLRRLSLPAGLVFGVVLASLGLGDGLLSWIL